MNIRKYRLNMKIEKLKLYLNILLYIFKNRPTEVRAICNEFNLSYTTVEGLIKKWMEEGYIYRQQKEILLLGGDRFEYSMTDTGINLLRDLKKNFEQI